MSYSINNDPWLRHAIQVIKADYGHTVSLEAKNKDLLKFGRNADIQTSKTTIMTLPSGIYNETYISSNSIAYVSSTSGSDTMDMVVEGHTIDGSGDFTFVTQTVTLAGQTKTALTTPLARCTRMYNNGSSDMVGTIYAYEDDTVTAGVPVTGAKVHCMIDAGFNNSEKASTTISSIDYWIVTNFYGDVMEKAAAWALIHFEIRRKGKVFRNLIDREASDQNGVNYDFKPYVIIPPNSDVRLRASANTNGIDVSGGINGALLKIA